ncbi:hypothetical protein AAEI02_20990, partial [Shewanella xiamenensis]|uniref:hypothetical protein n=1 Tax=Shewanella xiamenensis TaxID=332186 RepID=UPI00313B1EF7
WCRSFYEKLIARSHYLNSGISCGMTAIGKWECQYDVWNIIDHALHDILASCLSDADSNQITR